MTGYQIFLLLILVAWPLMIFGLLFLMSRLENYVAKLNADNPEEAGLEPVEGTSGDREVKIVFGEQVIGE